MEIGWSLKKVSFYNIITLKMNTKFHPTNQYDKWVFRDEKLQVDVIK